MATICFISCNLTEEPYPVFPLGMTMVADAARRKGHAVSEWDVIRDGMNDQKLHDFIKKNNPDFIGLSLRNIDNVNYANLVTYLSHYKTIAQIIKNASSAPIIVGGSAFSIFPELLLDELAADYGIVGEGERLFCSLIEQLEDHQPVPQKIFRETSFIAAETITCSSRNSDLAAFYLHKGGMLNIQTKRGCPHNCVYCIYPHLEGNRYRFRPVEEIVDEIEMLIEKHQADYLAVTDSVFNDARDHYLSIAETIVRRNVKINWMCFLRPQNFNQHEVELLQRAGLKAVEWGTDCADDRTLQQMGKSFDWATVLHSNSLFAKAGIANSHFIIFGGPGETEKTFQQGLVNLQRLTNCVIFAALGVRVFPNTPIYEKLLQEGWLKSEQNLLEPLFYFSPEINVHEVHQKLLTSFANSRDRIYPDGHQVEKIRAFHLLGYRGPIWDLLLHKSATRSRG